MSTTPNMNLDVPDVGEAGPGWAEKIRADLSTIDAHDHSSGNGAPIPHSAVTGLGTMATQNASAVAVTGGTITGMSAPTAPSDVATKAYVDSTAGGSAITSLTGDVVAVGPGTAAAGLVNIPANTPAIFIRFTGIGGPGTPSAGKGNAYYDQTGKVLALVNDAGVVSHTVKTKTSTTHQFLTAIADDGTVSAAQPAFSDLTGTLTASQLPAFTGDVTTSAGSSVTTLANIPSDVTMAGDLLATVMAAPATPTTGKARVYVDSTSKNLAVKSSDGVVKHGVQTRNAATSIFLTGIGDDGQVTGAHPASTDLSDATAAGIAMFEAANVAAQQALLGLGPFATGGISLAGQLYGSSTGNTLTANIYSNTVTYGQLQQASANVLLGHGPGGFVPLSTLSTPVAAGTSHEFMGIGSNTMTGSTRGYVPAACTITFLEVDPQGGGAPTVDTVFTIYKNGSPTAATVTQGAGGHSGSVIFSGTFGVLTFNGTTDTLDIVCTPSTGGGGAWNVACTVGADTTGAPGDVAEIPCTDAGRTIIAAADAAAQRTALGLGSLATASSVTASQISDATTAGRSMLTAASATAQAELLAPSIASWGRGLVHNTSVPPSGSWTPDSYTSTTGVVSQETGGQYQIHGLTGGTDGRIVVIYCGATSSLGLNHEDSAATAADRFFSPTCAIGAGQAAILRYSGSLSRWVTIAAPAIYPGANVPNIGEVQFNYFGSALSASPGLYGSNLVWLDSYDTLQVGAIQLAARLQQKLGTATASANDLTLPGHNTAVNGSSSSSGGGNTYPITGTTTINRLDANGWQSGSVVTLVFGSALTVTNAGASASGTLYPFTLLGGANFAAAAGDVLTVYFNGSAWVEVNRRAASISAVKGIAHGSLVTASKGGANQQLADWTAGNIQQITLTANCTGTSTFVAPSGPAMLRLLVKQDATGSRTISWPAGVKWSGGAPTLTTTANAVDHFDLTYDGTSYYVRTTLNMV